MAQQQCSLTRKILCWPTAILTQGHHNNGHASERSGQLLCVPLSARRDVNAAAVSLRGLRDWRPGHATFCGSRTKLLERP